MNYSQQVTPYMTMTLSDRKWVLDETRYYPCGEVLATSPITGFDSQYWIYLDIDDHTTKRNPLVLKALIDKVLRDLLCFFWDNELMDPLEDSVEEYTDLISWHCLIKNKRICDIIYKGHGTKQCFQLTPGLWAVKLSKKRGHWQLVSYKDPEQVNTQAFLQKHPWVLKVFNHAVVEGELV